MHSMTTNRRASGTEYSTLPTHVQCTEHKRLWNEIAKEIRNDMGINPANAEWTKVRT